MNAYNEREQALLRMYTAHKLGCTSECERCRQQNQLTWLPTSAWFVGNQFSSDPHRLLFVGKSARGNPGTQTEFFSNVFEDGRKLWYKSWPYWSYTRAIVRQLYGDDSAEHVAFTNVVKCNNSIVGDQTTDSMKRSCILQNGFIGEEIKLICPKTLIFYTGYGYDGYIKSMFDSFAAVTDTTIPNGKVTIPWLEAEVSLNGRKIHLLRTAHPQNKNKEDFVQSICDWVNRLD